MSTGRFQLILESWEEAAGVSTESLPFLAMGILTELQSYAVHGTSKITHSFRPGSRPGAGGVKMCGPAGQHEELALAPRAVLGELVQDGGWLVPGVLSVPACHQPCTPSWWLRRGAEARYQGRRSKDTSTGKVCTHGWPLSVAPEARVFCLQWELKTGRLQGQFAQLDCGRISKWAQGQGKLRKQECAWAHATYTRLNEQLFHHSC